MNITWLFLTLNAFQGLKVTVRSPSSDELDRVVESKRLQGGDGGLLSL